MPLPDGIPVATDGPFAESKESLAGYWIVDVENEARALEIALADRRVHRRSRSRCARSWTARRRSTVSVPDADRIEDLLRELAPQVLGTLVRRHGQFDACEDAVQEALLAAAQQWADRRAARQPAVVADDGRLSAAGRRMAQRERPAAPRGDRWPRWSSPGQAQPSDRDDTLTLLFLCCHPSLSVPSQLALTLRAVGGLTTAEIASAFLVPEATMAQRISRAKQSIKASGLRFDLPPEPERADRLRVVLQVLYLVFNEGYTTSSGPALHRADLTTEAIRLTRMLHELTA